MRRLGRATVFAGILVIAGLLLAVSPPWTGSPSSLDGAVTLRLERSTFAIGDDVGFTEQNGRREAIYLPCADPWVVHRAIGGEWYRVESHECDATIRAVESGDVYEGVWHSGARQAAGLTAIEPGYYRIDMVAYSCPDGFDKCQRIATFAFFWLR